MAACPRVRLLKVEPCTLPSSPPEYPLWKVWYAHEGERSGWIVQSGKDELEAYNAVRNYFLSRYVRVLED